MFSAILPAVKLVAASPITRVAVTRAVAMFAAGTGASIAMESLTLRARRHNQERINDRRLATEALGLQDMETKIKLARNNHRILGNAVLNAEVRANDPQRRRLAKTAQVHFRDTVLRPMEAEYDAAIKAYLKEHELPRRTRFVEESRLRWAEGWTATKNYFTSAQVVTWTLFSIGYGLSAAGNFALKQPLTAFPNMEVVGALDAAELAGKRLGMAAAAFQYAGIGSLIYETVGVPAVRRFRKEQRRRLALKTADYDTHVTQALNDEVDLDDALKNYKESPFRFIFDLEIPDKVSLRPEDEQPRSDWQTSLAMFLAPLDNLHEEERQKLIAKYRNEVAKTLLDHPLEVPERLLDVTDWTISWLGTVLRPDDLAFNQGLSLILHRETHPTVISKNRPNRKEFFRLLDERVFELAKEKLNA